MYSNINNLPLGSAIIDTFIPACPIFQVFHMTTSYFHNLEENTPNTPHTHTQRRKIIVLHLDLAS